MVRAVRMREYAALAGSSGPSVTPARHCFQMSEQATKPTLLYKVGGVIIESSTHGTFRWGFLSVRCEGGCSLRIRSLGEEFTGKASLVGTEEEREHSEAIKFMHA